MRFLPPTQVGLKIGSYGPEVRTLHQLLEHYELLTIAEEGEPKPTEDDDFHFSSVPIVTGPEQFTDITATAVRRLQAHLKVTVTGVFDRATVDAVQGISCFSRAVDRNEFAGIPFDEPVLTYRILNLPSGFSASEVLPAVSQAFAIWSVASRLSFRRISGDQSDITVRFRSIDGQEGVLGNALIELDDDERWSIRTTENVGGSSYDLISVLTHEIGHTLGLNHDENPDSVMFESMGHSTRYRKLRARDILAIQAIWGEPKVTTVSSIHGNTARAEHSDRLSFQRPTGPAGVFIGIDQPTWLHITPPTPLLIDDRSVRLNAVRLKLQTHAGGMVREIDIWDGDRLLERHLIELRTSNTSETTVHRVTLGIAEKPTIREGIEISINIAFATGVPQANRRVDVISAGCDLMGPGFSAEDVVTLANFR